MSHLVLTVLLGPVSVRHQGGQSVREWRLFLLLVSALLPLSFMLGEISCEPTLGIQCAVGWIMFPSKIHSSPTPAPVKVALFGNRVCRCDLVKMRSHWLNVGPGTRDWCPYEKRIFGRRDMKSQREITTWWWRQSLEWYVRRPRSAKDSHQKLGERHGADAPRAFRGSVGLLTSCYQTSGLHAERINFCSFQLPCPVLICYSSLRKLIHKANSFNVPVPSASPCSSGNSWLK